MFSGLWAFNGEILVDSSTICVEIPWDAISMWILSAVDAKV
jgi:hypothetical protein